MVNAETSAALPEDDAETSAALPEDVTLFGGLPPVLDATFYADRPGGVSAGRLDSVRPGAYATYHRRSNLRWTSDVARERQLPLFASGWNAQRARDVPGALYPADCRVCLWPILGGYPQGELGLSAASNSRVREESRAEECVLGVVKLALTANKAGDLGRRV